MTIACTATSPGRPCWLAIAASSATILGSSAGDTPTRTASSSVRCATLPSFTTNRSPSAARSGWSTAPSASTNHGATDMPAADRRFIASSKCTIGPASLATSRGVGEDAGVTACRSPRTGVSTKRLRASTARYTDWTPRPKRRPRSRHSATQAPTPVASTGLTTNGMSDRAATLANGVSRVRLQPSSPSPVHQPSTRTSTEDAYRSKTSSINAALVITNPVRSSGFTVSPGTRSRTHASISGSGGRGAPSSSARSVASAATPPDVVIMPILAIRRWRTGASCTNSWARSSRSSTSRAPITPCSRKARSYTQLSSAMAPVWDCMILRARSERPSFRAITGLPAARAPATAAKNSPGRRTASITRQMTEVCGSAASTATWSARSHTASLPDDTAIDTPSARSLAAASAERARKPLWETTLTPPTVATPLTGSSSRPPVNRFTPSRTFLKPAQFGPTTAIPVRPATSSSRCWSNWPCSPASTNPAAATITPPQPSVAASSTTSIDRSAFTSDKTASTGSPIAVRSANTGRSYSESRRGLTSATCRPASSIGSTALFDIASCSFAPTTATVTGESIRARLMRRSMVHPL